MSELKALCMKCRDNNNKPTMQTMNDPKIEQNEKGRFQARGTCSNCGGNMFKFLSKEDAEKFQSA